MQGGGALDYASPSKIISISRNPLFSRASGGVCITAITTAVNAV